MVARKPGRQGEHEGNRNTIAQGRPGVFRQTCGRLPCAFYLLHTGLWVRRAPGFPCALLLRGERNLQTSDASRRENAFVCHSRAREAADPGMTIFGNRGAVACMSAATCGN